MTSGFKNINNRTIWIVADFNASKRFTHHWSYVKRFYEFLSENQENFVQCWIAKSAEKEVIDSLGINNVRLILRSPDYSFERNQNFFYWLQDHFIKKIINLEILNILPNLKEFAKNTFQEIYIRKAFKEVKKLSREKENVNLIFPTCDTLSIRFIKKIEQRNLPNVNLYLRLLTGENRGVFSQENYLTFLDEVSSHGRKIIIGFETDTYLNSVQTISLMRRIKVWSPIPPDSEMSERIANDASLTLGFLGSARPNKGFSEIPKLLHVMSEVNPNYNAIIQKSTYSWSGFPETLEELETSFKDNIQLVDGNITQKKLMELFNKVSILVLPYNKKLYEFAGSGLLFTAADLKIPIIATKNVAFSWDIEKFGIGMTYETEAEFAKAVEYCSKRDFTEEFENYRIARINATKNFLGLLQE